MKLKIDKLDLILTEVKSMYQEINENSKILDDKALSIIAGSTIILTLFSALQSAITPQKELIQTYNRIIYLIILLFIIMIIILLSAIFPRKYKMVFISSWENIENGILIHKKLENVYIQLITNYLDRIEENSKINRKKSRLLIIASIIFSIIFVLIIIASIFKINNGVTLNVK